MYKNWFVYTSFNRYRNVYLHAGRQQRNGGEGGEIGGGGKGGGEGERGQRIFRIDFKPMYK